VASTALWMVRDRFEFISSSDVRERCFAGEEKQPACQRLPGAADPLATCV